MDLNINNYTTSDLLAILQIDDDDLSVEILQKALFTKFEKIKNTKDELPDTKDNLLTFFTECFFKIVNQEELYKNYKDPPDILVKEKLLPPMTSNNVINNHAVTPPINDSSVITLNTNLQSGIINPLKRKSFKKILNVNTRFRDNYNTTKSTDFQMILPYPIKKVSSLKLITNEFPKTVYSFSSILGSNTFQIAYPSGTSYTTIDISSGSYSTNGIVNVINQSLFNNGIIDVSLNYNDNNGKMTFTGNDIFDIKFDYIETNICPLPRNNVDSNQLTLGWMLGFRGNSIINQTATLAVCKCGLPKNSTCIGSIWPPPLRKKQVCIYDYPHDLSNVYVGESIYTSEAIFDGHGTRYFLLSVNDFQNNHNEIFISPFKQQTLGDNNILAKISTDCCNDNCCDKNPERIYLGPVDLNKFHFKLLDEFGRIVDINNSDYSFTLELETVYDL